MEHVRYRVATTSMRNKSSGYETPTAVVSSRVAPSTGESENSYHPGRRQRSRRRDVYAAPDDFVRVSAMSPPPADTVRRRIDRTSDFHVQSPTSYWAQPAYATPDSRAVQARSRSRPRPAPPLLHELGVQRDYGPPRDSANSSRYQEQQMTEESRHRQRQRQRQQQQQQHVAPSLIPSPNFTTPRSAIDYRPQVSMTTTTPSLLPGRTFTSLPAPPGPVSSSPSYMNDNKALLKEALISAAAAKLSRSSSARSAVVRPLVVIRNGPAKSSSDEDVDDVVTTATTSTTEVKSTVSNAYGPESSSTRSVETPVLHTAADVAIATAAAAAAAATRRSRTHRRDVDLVATNVTSVTNSIVVTTGASTVVSAGITSQQVGAGTRSTRAGHRDQTAAGGDGVSLQSRAMPVSALSATSVHDAAAAGLHRATRPMEDAAERSQTTLASSSCDSQHQETVLSTPGVVAADTTHVSFETLNKTPRTRRTVRDNREDLRLSTNKFTPTRNVQLADKPVNDSSVTETAEISSSPVTEAGTLQESPGSTSKVAFIKSLLSRTRSPSPTRCRRGRSKTQHTSPNPSSVKRIGAEVAQRIGAPVKGYLKQLRDRSMSSQRRRAAEPVAAASTKTTQEESEPVTAPCQSRGAADCLTRPSDVLSSSAESAASSDDRTADDMSGGRGRRFRAERRNQDHNSGSSNSSTPALTSQWKSTSELTTPMSRLDNLLKANSMQHLQAAAAAASTTTGASQTIVETSGNTARAASSTLAPSSPPALTNKTSQSTGCLLSSSADRSLTPQFEHQRTTPTTTMTRCYLEKPPRAARRAVTVQLDRRLVDASSLASTERQSTSQADLRTVDEVPATSSDVSNRQSAAQRSITSSATSTSSAAASCRHGATTSSQNERDLRELYEQKRLERQLEEKLALMEKERAGVIAKLWSQIDHQNSATTQPQRRTPAPAAGSDHSQNSTSTFGLVLPLSDDAASPTGSNSQVNMLVVCRKYSTHFV